MVIRRAFCIGMVVLTQFVLSFASRPALCDEPVASDRKLPPGVLAYASLTSVDELKQRWDESLAGQLQRDQEVQTFIEELKNQFRPQFEEISANIEVQLGVTVDDLLNLPSGEIAIAVAQSGRNMWVAGFLDFGDSKDTVEALMDKADETSTAGGALHTTESIEGTDVSVLTFPAEEVDNELGAKQPEDQTLVYFIKDTFLVLASNVNAAEEILARWDGEHDRTLAAQPIYQYIRTRCKGDDDEPLGVFYLDPMGLVRYGVSQIQGPMAAQINFGMAMLPVLGIDKLKAVGGTYDLASGDFNSIARTLVYVDQPPTGVMEIFQCKPIDPTPPQWVTNGVASYSAVNWDIKGAYSAIETLYDSFNGPGGFAEMVDRMSEEQDGTKIHLKHDLIDQLTGKIHIVTKLDQAKDVPTESVLVGLELTDIRPMKETLAKVTREPGFQGEVRDFRGESIIELELPDALDTGNGKLGIAVSQGELMFSSDVMMLEQVMRGDSDQTALADLKEFKQVMEHMPDKICAVGFQKQQGTIESLYNMLKSGNLPAVANVPIDFSRLPDYEVLKKYMPAAGSYALPDQNGVVFVSFTLQKDKR